MSREKGDILEGQSTMYDNREKNNWHSGKVERAEEERTLLLFTSNGWKCTYCQDTAQLFFIPGVDRNVDLLKTVWHAVFGLRNWTGYF